MRRFILLRRTLRQLGVEDERVQLVWASASEGTILAEKIDRMTEQLRPLGPLNWNETVLGRNGYATVVAADATLAIEEV